jgi:hypothetical protein
MHYLQSSASLLPMVSSPVSQRPLPAGDPLYVPRPDAEQLLRRALALGLNVAVQGDGGTGKTTLINRVIATGSFDKGDKTIWIDCHGLSVRDTLYRIAEGWGWSTPTFTWELKPEFENAFTPSMLGITHKQVPVPPDAGRVGREDIDLLSRVIVPPSDDTSDDAPPQWLAVLENPSAAAVAAIFGGHRDQLWRLPVQWVVATRSAISSDAALFFETQVTLRELEPRAARDLLDRRLAAAGHEDRKLVDTIAERIPLYPRDLVAAARDGLLHAEDAPARFELQERLTQKAAAIGRPHSMLMSELLARGAVSASDDALLQRLGYSRARLAQLLAEMSEAGLLVKERDGRKVMFKPAGLDQ